MIRDAHSEEGIPFASIQFLNSTVGKLSDSSGAFSFYLSDWPSDTLQVTCVGYQPFKFPINQAKDSILATINLERGTFNEGVKVKVKVNKGLLVWRKIVQHKPENDRYRFDNFSYELYNKLELDIKNFNFGKIAKFKPLRPVGDLINQNIDSSEGVKYLPTYLTEAISDYYYQKKPLRRREMIKAANTNGVKNESMIKFLGGMDQIRKCLQQFHPCFRQTVCKPCQRQWRLLL